MKGWNVVLAVLGLTIGGPAIKALAQTPPPAPEAVEEVEIAVVERVAVTVNGHKITEEKIDAMFTVIINSQTRGQSLPESVMADAHKSMRPEILNTMIADRLLDEDVEKADIVVKEEEYLVDIRQALNGHLLKNGATQAEFEERVKAGLNISLEEFLEKQASDENFRRSLRQVRLMEKKFPTELTVTQEEIKVRYERDVEGLYTKPEMVKASHVLIGTQPTSTDEEKAAARKKADDILLEAKKPDADFAKLAGEYSTCPSKSNGGDLGFFPRTGAMVEPFAVAAYGLKPGEVSGVVETKFGYHIIMTTERKDATVITVEQASEGIKRELMTERLGPLREKHVAALKENAEIVYPVTEAPKVETPVTATTEAVQPVPATPEAAKPETKPTGK